MAERGVPDRIERVLDLQEAWRDEPSTVRTGEPLVRALEVLLSHPTGRTVHVVDDEGVLRGVILFRDLLTAVSARYAATEAHVFTLASGLREVLPEKVDGLMRKPAPIRPDSTLQDAFFILDDTRQTDLPIVDAEGRLVGELNGLHLMEVGLRLFREGRARAPRTRSRDAR